MDTHGLGIAANRGLSYDARSVPEIRNQQVVGSSPTAGSNKISDSAIDWSRQGANRGAYVEDRVLGVAGGGRTDRRDVLSLGRRVRAAGRDLPVALAIFVLWLLLHMAALEWWATWSETAGRLIVGPRA